MQREPQRTHQALSETHQIFLCKRERSRAEKRERSLAEIVQTTRLRRSGMNECLVFRLSLILIQE